MIYSILRLQLFAGTFFRGFGILCILLVLNLAGASRLMIFMMVCSQYLIFSSINFCAFVQIHKKYQTLVPAKNNHLMDVFSPDKFIFRDFLGVSIY